MFIISVVCRINEVIIIKEVELWCDCGRWELYKFQFSLSSLFK